MRQYYLQALTAASRGDREQAFADTFRGLGQVIHLIQDAASPGHTRNDSHPRYSYETLIGDVQREEGPVFASWLALSREPNPGWARLPSDPLAPAPIARLLDTDQYTGTNPQITTSPLIGLSEYTNANFFSEDRTLPEDTLPPFRYPYPARSSVREADYRITLRTDKQVTRRYFLKVADGDTGYRLATVGFLRAYLQRYNLDPARFRHSRALDEGVYKDYGTRLVPRAVGYSKALLDYFFRGTLDFEVKPKGDDPTLRELKITNAAAEAMDGDFHLYAEEANGTRSRVVTFPLRLEPATESAPLTFRPLPGVRAYALVFQGTLGAEAGAVAGKVKPWAPPFLFVIQETAELTGDDAVVQTGTGGDLYVARASASRSQDNKKQKATGRFFFPGEPTPGEYVKRIGLSFVTPGFGLPLPASSEARLRLNGVEVGQAWDREASPGLVPVTWEVVLDLAKFTESVSAWPSTINVPRVPYGLLVQLLDETWISTPLLWWRGATSTSLVVAGQEPFYGCSLNQCSQVSANDESVTVEVFFGDGDLNGNDTGQFPLSAPRTRVSFTPTQGVMGFPVGALENSCTGPGCGPWFDQCPPPGPLTISNAQVFASYRSDLTPVWAKNRAQVDVSDQTYVRRDAGTCGRPPQVGAASPPALPELRFRRDYSVAEQHLFQEFNVVPPEYEITLK